MFKLHVLLFALMSVYAGAELQLLVPPENLALISTSGKSVQTATAAPAVNLDQSDDEPAVDDISTSNDADGASDDDDNEAAPAPASVKRISSGSSASGRSSVLLQHQILPAAALPLPITIATRPGLRTILAPETITIHQPTVAKIGEVVQRVPTAVSHQSQTVVHKHANVRTPILAPAVRSVTQHVVRAIHQPLILSPNTRLVNL